jgi:hypothetical protein
MVLMNRDEADFSLVDIGSTLAKQGNYWRGIDRHRTVFSDFLRRPGRKSGFFPFLTWLVGGL